MRFRLKIIKTLFIISFLAFISTTNALNIKIPDIENIKDSSIEIFKTLSIIDIIIPDDYDTIQKGIDHAQPGDIIFVKSGLYIENIIIDVEELSLIGENKFNTVIDADKNTKDAVNILAPNVTVQDFTITNAHSNTRAPWDQSGMKIYSSNVIVKNNMFVSNKFGINVYSFAYNLTIKNNEFIEDGILLGNYIFEEPYEYPEITIKDFTHNIRDNIVNSRPLYYYINQRDFIVPTNAGQIILVNCSNVTIKDLCMSRNDFAILLAYCDNCTIENVIVSDTDGEILLFESTNNIIKNIDVYDTFKGICLEINSNNNVVCYNNFSGNYVGISMYTSSFDNEIIHNKAFNNEAAGIEMISLHGGTQQRNKITHNKIYDNKYGILLQYNSINNIIQNNTITNNEIGIFLGESSDDNQIEDNTFKNDIIPAMFIGCKKNFWNHNYWNRPRFLRKYIFGFRNLGNIKIPWVNIDKDPAFQPPV
jgi:parallel beta-helix repeat protein